MANIQRHPFHLVDPSPWPLFAAFGSFSLVSGLTIYIHQVVGGFFLLCFGFCFVLYGISVWWRDVVREGTYQGHHTFAVQAGLRWGILLFIASEVMFFVAFFWAFFHASLAPTIEVGAVWPPKGLVVLSPWEIPLLNTVILLTSGASVTWAHHAILSGYKRQAVISLIITVVLAGIFTAFQGAEYVEAPFSLSDGVYGSTFFMATGFHGFHVLIGTCFLGFCLYRLLLDQFTKKHHVGFEAAAWYWHFVDVVWLFLFISIIYWWGGVLASLFW